MNDRGGTAEPVNGKAPSSSGQDAALSRLKHGFDSRRGHQPCIPLSAGPVDIRPQVMWMHPPVRNAMDFDSISPALPFAAAGAAAMAVALFAGVHERRERRRRDLDRISAVPWALISVLASMLAIILLATAAKSYFAAGA